MSAEAWWHGGPRITGDMVLPPAMTGSCRSGDEDHRQSVFITPDRGLATTYASTCNGWVYEVAPEGDITQDPGSFLPPGTSMMCPRARIVRRFKPSRVEVERRRALVGLFAALDLVRLTDWNGRTYACRITDEGRAALEAG